MCVNSVLQPKTTRLCRFVLLIYVCLSFIYYVWFVLFMPFCFMLFVGPERLRFVVEDTVQAVRR